MSDETVMLFMLLIASGSGVVQVVVDAWLIAKSDKATAAIALLRKDVEVAASVAAEAKEVSADELQRMNQRLEYLTQHIAQVQRDVAVVAAVVRERRDHPGHSEE